MVVLSLLSAVLVARQPDPTIFCQIANPAVTESSGIASSHIRRINYYTHNDSGDNARFFEFNPQGAVTATYTLANTQAVDWEDMSSAKIGRKSWIYLADFGDNNRVRSSVRIHRVAEPQRSQSATLTPETFTYTYEGGPQNAEALAVDPKDGTLWIVAKVNDGASGVFRISQPRSSGTQVAQRVGTLNINETLVFARLVTGAALSPNRKWIAIRSYTQIHLFPYGPNWWEGRRTVWTAPIEGQGEAICFSSNGRSILTTSEGNPCPVSQLMLPRTFW